MSDPLLGQTIGNWRVERLVGAGGMGRVYEALQPSIGARVAIKVLARECAEDRDLVDRFFAEARAVNLIRHEHIVKVIDLAFLPDGRPYIVMDFIDGAPLSACIAGPKRPPLGGLCEVVREVLAAIGAAHDRGVVHRDLKPDNVFVTPAGHARVLDFGIAKLAPDLAKRSGPTRSGMLLGTPTYMSPEQASGKAVDARTDVYAIGVMLYEGATGSVPFDAPVLFELLRQQIHEAPPPPRERRGEITPELEAVILKAMAKDPAQRFASAAEMSAALAEAARGLPESERARVDPFAGAAGGGDVPATRARATPELATTAAMDTRPRAAAAGSAPRVEEAEERVAGERAATTARTRLRLRTGWLAAGALALGMAVAAVAVVVLRERKERGVAGDGVAAAVVSATPDAGPLLLATGPLPTPGGGASVAMAPGGAAAVAPGPAGGGTVSAPVAKVTPPKPPAGAKNTPPKPSPAAEPGDPSSVKPPSDTGGPDPTSTEGLTGETGSVLPRYTTLEVPSPSRFDAMSFMSTANAAARKFQSDAALAQMIVMKAQPGGHTDLTLGGTVMFVYRSKAASANPPARCMVNVTVTSWGAQVAETPHDDCDMPIIGTPKCTPVDIWKRAQADGAPEKGVAELLYMWWQGKKSWHFNLKDFHKQYDDDCAN